MTTADDVVQALLLHRFQVSSEDMLQAAVYEVLAGLERDTMREVILGPGERIDVMCDQVAVEVKIAGAVAQVARQLDRYSMHPRVHELVLVTTRPQHMAVPRLLNGKTVHVVNVAGSGL